MNRKLYLIVILIVVVASIALSSRIGKKFYAYLLVVSLEKQFNTYEGGREFIKEYPEFIKLISNYPENLVIVKRVIIAYPEFVHTRFLKEFVHDLRNSSHMRYVMLSYSNYPNLAAFSVEHYDVVSLFNKKYPNAADWLKRQPEFSDYFLNKHFDRFKELLMHPDLKNQIVKEVYEQFIVEKYIKTDNFKGRLSRKEYIP